MGKRIVAGIVAAGLFGGPLVGCGKEKAPAPRTCAAVQPGTWERPGGEYLPMLPHMAQKIGANTPLMQDGRVGQVHCEPGYKPEDVPLQPNFTSHPVTGVPQGVGELCVIAAIKTGDPNQALQAGKVYTEFIAACPALSPKL